MSARFPALTPHDPAWALLAKSESSRLRVALGRALVTVHHIGSTAVPALRAKPIVDLLVVVRGLKALDATRVPVEALGYAWLGEHGVPGRRYCVFDDPVSGQRLVQARFLPADSPDIARHLAFRDALRERRDLARVYEADKGRCQALHLEDAEAYAECKRPWIDAAEAEAVAALAENAEPPA
jgi:GrpB-like predicted nucleotidyltransferase (UPF0157 family)